MFQVKNISAGVTAWVLMSLAAPPTFAGFRVKPYLLGPGVNGVTVVWFSDDASPGTLTVELPDGGRDFRSTPRRAQALAYHPLELDQLPDGADTAPPYMHVVRVEGLRPGARYGYLVQQGGERYENTLAAAPASDRAVRFIVFGDCETEPESTGKLTLWPQPGGDRDRRYVVDQTEGFRQNLRVILGRAPGFLAFAGDLVESGGEQRDWEEFWRQLNGELGNLAGSVPLVASPGNHETYGGPGEFGKFGDEDHRRAIAKFQTYFGASLDGSAQPRYHRLDFGPVTFISLDSTNGLPAGTGRDTNWKLAAQSDADDFNPGSPQYRWLEAQLADAQERSAFTFVQFHHVPYSVGPHGFPAGDKGHDRGEDWLSGVPMRALTPLFMRYGVDAVFGGHDEMYEHSLIRDGVEQLPGGTGATRPHELHVFDVGIAGDGLRGPYFGPDGKYSGFGNNEQQVFLAHHNAPEVWDGKRLVSGGKHYGHMEVNVSRDDTGRWRAVLTPVYVFPLMDKRGGVTGWERRVYDDEVTLGGQAPEP
jgi:Calcineurin-like phosphoesterase